MPTTRRSRSRGGRPRRGVAAIELAIIMPVLLLLILGCFDFGRFADASLAVTNAVRAGAGVALLSHYPDPDPNTSTGLINWQKRICQAVADELGMTNDFTPVGSGDPNGYTNSQGLYVQASRSSETGGLWRAEITARCPFTWWGIPSDTQPQRTVVYRAIR